MKNLLTIALWITMVIFLILGIAQAKTDVMIYSQGQEPTVSKMPDFAYLGTRPLMKDDKIVAATHFSAKGKDIYEKIIEYHEKVYLEKGWNPSKMRMLVTVGNVNKAFTISGNVAANFSENVSNMANSFSPGLSTNKSTSNSLGSSGGIFPSWTKSWIDQKFTIWFFLTE
jgi:hypothetical protein